MSSVSKLEVMLVIAVFPFDSEMQTIARLNAKAEMDSGLPAPSSDLASKMPPLFWDYCLSHQWYY